MTNIEVLFIQSATRGQCQTILPPCKRLWAWFTERLCLHCDLIFIISHIFSFEKCVLSTQHVSEKEQWQECRAISDGHGLTTGAFFNKRLTFHYLHSLVASSPLRTTSPVMTTQALSETSALPSTMTVVTVVCYLSPINNDYLSNLH